MEIALTAQIGSLRLYLDPDHAQHQSNLNNLTKMELLILDAYLAEIRSTIQTAFRYQAQAESKNRMIADGILSPND